MRFNIEDNDDDPEDEDYQPYAPQLSDEAIRAWINGQYVGVLQSPDYDEWEDRCGEMGTISIIEDATQGKFKESNLLRRQIKRTLPAIMVAARLGTAIV